MLFSYRAKSKNGEIIEGVLEAADRNAVSVELKSRSVTPLSISEKSENFFSKISGMMGGFGKVSVAEQTVFTKNLGGMLTAGLSLSRALSVLQKQTKNKVLNKILIALSADINKGDTLSTGLAKFPNVFSKIFVAMTKAGEESGNLAGALSEIGISLEKTNALNKRIKGALIYPGVIFSAMIVIGILMFAFVVPTLGRTFKELGVTLPISTQVLVFVGNFFSNNLILSFVSLIALAIGGTLLFRAKFMAKYIDFALLKIPFLNTLTMELNTARTSRTISSLLASGVSITRAVEITEDVVQNIYYKKVLNEAGAAIEKGAPFSQVFEENGKLYPVMMTEMIQVGEETGKLADMLLQIALFYEGEIENKTKNLSTIIEPVLMIVIGAGVGFFAISMISPLYSILDSIK